MISHTRLLCFLLSGSFGLIHHVIAQTACQDFGTGLITDYPIWSQAHIQPWCNDHDPASTGQCACTWFGLRPLCLTNHNYSPLLASNPTLSKAKEIPPRFSGMVDERKAPDRYPQGLHCSVFCPIRQHDQQQQRPQRSRNMRSVQFQPSSPSRVYLLSSLLRQHDDYHIPRKRHTVGQDNNIGLLSATANYRKLPPRCSAEQHASILHNEMSLSGRCSDENTSPPWRLPVLPSTWPKCTA